MRIKEIRKSRNMSLILSIIFILLLLLFVSTFFMEKKIEFVILILVCFGGMVANIRNYKIWNNILKRKIGQKR